MDQSEVKAITEHRFKQLGASRLELSPSGVCWTLHGNFFKVTTLTNFWVIEWTDDYFHASHYGFEDVDPMPYECTAQEIMEAVDRLLLK